ncbi:hypothetical protein EVG20_g911 [Dentipellis fragilis]|uniref:C2H2-type domain-containing protein n=1 Tax=Dentipellis fragilis TaxID=205917 RepID=A0A4Y9ZCA5_9AGAM|nr:hypothetical protein EVG20_g911 [Dentipellis fragilis]
MRHEHPIQYPLPTTQAAHSYTNSPYNNIHDFLDSPTVLFDASLDYQESALDFQSNGILQESIASKPLGLGIFFDGYDPFAQETGKIDLYDAGSDDGSVSPIFSFDLPMMSTSLSAPDFPPSSHASFNDGPRTPSDMASGSPPSPRSLLEDPWTVLRDAMDVQQDATSPGLNHQPLEYDLMSTAGTPLIGLFPDFNMYSNTIEDVDLSMGINPQCLLLHHTPLLGSSHMQTTPLMSPKILAPWPASGLLNQPALAQDPLASIATQATEVQVKAEPDIAIKQSPTASPLLHAMDTDEPHVIMEPLQSNLATRYNHPLSGLGITVAGNTFGTASPDTPVFNAHLGVSELDLVRRANRYRKRHPGQEIDRRWFLVYAGKLSSGGQPIEDYRCYIEGCSKTNKRRDHILVHVGSHVSERPFACAHCSMRFLRRNECKRHEANHTGEKPFACELCLEAVRFARQDLLTRHMRRTHGVDRTSGNKSKRKREQSSPESELDYEGDEHFQKRLKAEPSSP